MSGCGKICYASRAAAARAGHAVQGRPRGGRQVRRPYWCGSCHAYHITRGGPGEAAVDHYREKRREIEEGDYASG